MYIFKDRNSRGFQNTSDRYRPQKRGGDGVLQRVKSVVIARIKRDRGKESKKKKEILEVYPCIKKLEIHTLYIYI